MQISDARIFLEKRFDVNVLFIAIPFKLLLISRTHFEQSHLMLADFLTDMNPPHIFQCNMAAQLTIKIIKATNLHKTRKRRNRIRCNEIKMTRKIKKVMPIGITFLCITNELK